MEEYKVNDYSEFDDGISTTNSYIDKLNTSIDSIANQMTSLNNESTFMGPACDSAVQAHTAIGKALSSNVSNFQSISSYLGNTSDNYKAGDKAASETVESTDGTSTTEMSKPSDTPNESKSAEGGIASAGKKVAEKAADVIENAVDKIKDSV